MKVTSWILHAAIHTLLSRAIQFQLKHPGEHLCANLQTLIRFTVIRVTIDSGATGNMMRLSAVQRLGVEIQQSSQSAHEADGSSPLKVFGETRLGLARGDHLFHFEGLDVENLDVDVLAGTPFMETNDNNSPCQTPSYPWRKHHLHLWICLFASYS